MPKWEGFLLVILVIRLVLGGVMSESCLKGERVKVAGIVEEIYQDITKKNILVGNFLIEIDVRKVLAENEKVTVVGKCGRRVIDFLVGRNRLIEGGITKVDEKVVSRVEKKGFFISLRVNLINALRKVVPWPESEVVAGIILGVKGNLGEYYDKFVTAGLVHVLVASGYNVAVVAAIFFNSLIGFVSRKKAVVIAMIGVVGYTLLAGAEAPLVRAAMMSGVVLGGKTYGKEVSPSRILWLVAWVMVMWEPISLINISFQLSVAATAGLIYLEPKFRRWIEKFARDWKGSEWLLKTEVTTSVAAQVTTAPIILWHFGRVSFWGVVTNIVVLPLVPYIMGVGVVAMILSTVWVPLGVVPGILVYGLSKVIVVISNFF